MTPEERQLVDDLFDRLARLETVPRDCDAETAIAEGLKRAPNAIYALVQTALVQDEALKRADARIRELTGDDAPRRGGFLDSMRQALTGRTSVPSIHAAATPESASRFNSGVYGAPASAGPSSQSAAGSFLGTAAASAAGMIGGALLLNSISSMFGHHAGGALAADRLGNSPWDNSAADSDLAREAGLNDIGGGGTAAEPFSPANLFDVNDNEEAGQGDDFFDDDGGDFGDDFSSDV